MESNTHAEKNNVRRTNTNIRKIAILLISLGSEYAAKLFKYLDDDAIDAITMEIAKQRKVSVEQTASVISEFYNMAVAHDYAATGGLAYAQRILKQALGPQKAHEVSLRLSNNLEGRPFEFLNKINPTQLINFIRHEHPQTIALIIAYMESQQAATVLAGLTPDVQAEVVRRIAKMDTTPPEIIHDVERLLERKVTSGMGQSAPVIGGVKAIVDVINYFDGSAKKTVMDILKQGEPELAEEIKHFMFVFEDIVKLDDRDLQKVLRQVDNKMLALALKGATTEIYEKIYNNISAHAAEVLREAIESMGPVRVRNVEAAQQLIIDIIRKMEEKGEIVIAYSREDEMID